jgi:hypothetical protein
VAGSVGDAQYLSLFRRADPSEFDPSGAREQVMVSGAGNYESAPLTRHDLWGFNWAAALDADQPPCPFSVTLVPEEGGPEPVVVVETLSVVDVEHGPLTGPGSQIFVPWGPSTGGSWDSFTIAINSGCNWAVRLELHGHD